MTKTPVLILGAAMLSGSLALLVWRSSRGLPADGGTEVPNAILLTRSNRGHDAAGTRPAQDDPRLAGIDPDPPKNTATIGGLAKSWEIIPINRAGQLLKDATICASLGGQGGLAGEADQGVLTGTGRLEWMDVTSGEWTVTVEAEGLPTWTKTLALYQGDVMRTTARLGDGIHIEGTIVDLDGRPVSAMLAYLLPVGAGHPRREDMVRENGASDGKLIPTGGAIGIKTGVKGQFKTVLPKAGNWRISVGPPGAARWTQPQGTELVNGGPKTAIVTIPAASTLRLSFGENPEHLPSEVIVYAFDPSRGGSADGGGSNGPGRSVKDAGAERAKPLTDARIAALPLAERQALKEKIVRGELEGIEDWRPAEEAASAPGSPMEAGWRAVRSSRPNPLGRVMIKELPIDQNLRLLFVRGSERITAPGAIRLEEGMESVGVITLPPPGTGPSKGTDLRAHIQMESTEMGPAARNVGVAWK